MRVAIVGAGLAGLAASLELARAGHSVTVYEAARQAGGLASGFRDERWEWPLERFYHHLFAADAAIRRLVQEVGYDRKLLFRRQITAQWWRGHAYAVQGGTGVLRLRLGPVQKQLQLPDIVTTALSVVGFPGLPLVDRVRMGVVSAYLKYLARDWQPLESSTAAGWTRRWMGRTAYQAFVYPLLEGKFGPYAEQVNMAWLWARLKARSFRLGYFEGGFQGFIDVLLAHVRRAGAVVELNRPISALSQLPGGRWGVSYACRDDPRASGQAEFDAVIVTGSPQLLSELAPQLPPAYLGQIRRLRSLGAVVVTLALRHRLTDGIYWMNLPKDQFPFLALVEHTNFVEAEHYGGDHLVYCGDYLDPSHEYFHLAESELLSRFIPALKAVNPSFEPSWVRVAWVHREPYAQPIVPVDHSHDIPSICTPLPGLFWASMSQVYPWDRGTNYAVELGQRAAREVISFGAKAGPAHLQPASSGDSLSV